MTPRKPETAFWFTPEKFFDLLGVHPPFSAVKRTVKALEPPMDAEHAEKSKTAPEAFNSKFNIQNLQLQ